MATKWSARFTCSSIHKWIENRPGEAEECRKRLQRLHALLAKPRRDDLCWWYKVGVEVQQILPKADRSYGSRVIRLLAKDLQPHEGQGGTGLVSRLYFARDLAAKYNLDEVRELAAKRNAAGNPLSVYHFERLLSLDDPEDRQAMLAQCVARNWSVRHLATVVQNRRGYKWRSGRFPQALQPMGLGTALRDIFLSSRCGNSTTKPGWAGRRQPWSGFPSRPAGRNCWRNWSGRGTV